MAQVMSMWTGTSVSMVGENRRLPFLAMAFPTARSHTAGVACSTCLFRGGAILVAAPLTVRSRVLSQAQIHLLAVSSRPGKALQRWCIIIIIIDVLYNIINFQLPCGRQGPWLFFFGNEAQISKTMCW